MKWFGLAALLAASGLAGAAQAGNVSAKISGGSLYLYGDNAANDIVLESNAADSITVIGLNGTTINGGNTPVQLSGWNNGVFAYMSGGDDLVLLYSGNVLGVTHFDLGAGSDDLMIGHQASLPEEFLLDPLFETLFGPDAVASAPIVRLGQSLTVLGFAGQDSASVMNCTVVGPATFDMGIAADSIQLGVDGDSISTYFQNSVVIVPGSGPDSVGISSTSVSGDMTIDDPTHVSTIDLFASHFGKNLFIFTSTAADTVNLTSVVVAGLTKTILKDANDVLNIDGLNSNEAQFFLGVGNDRQVASGLQVNKLWGYLEGGTDRMELTSSQVGTSYYFGAAGDDYFLISDSSGGKAYVYGDGGTDTLKQAGNSFSKVYAYSIEKKL